MFFVNLLVVKSLNLIIQHYN